VAAVSRFQRQTLTFYSQGKFIGLYQSRHEKRLKIQNIFVLLAKLRKAATSFVMSACPSVCPTVRMVQLSSHWTDFD
jgi:hypothetical protein